jgi:hypothetical protein
MTKPTIWIKIVVFAAHGSFPACLRFTVIKHPWAILAQMFYF